jgi:hypothetical protein
MEHLILKAIGALLTFLGDMLLRLLELFPDHSAERLRKRQVKLQLKRGLTLLGKKSFNEADIHFGTALTIQPDIARVLSKREIKKIMVKLPIYGGGPNANRLWLELNNHQIKMSRRT